MHAAVRSAIVVAAGAVVTLAALGVEPAVRGDPPWPIGPLSISGGVFRPRPGRTVDLDEAAESARRALPGHEAVVLDWSSEPMLIVGRVDGPTQPQPLRDWRDASKLPLDGPDEASFGRTSPDWFSRPRRGHDAAFALVALAVSAAVVLPLTRRRN
jgi:hypothetical protein